MELPLYYLMTAFIQTCASCTIPRPHYLPIPSRLFFPPLSLPSFGGHACLHRQAVFHSVSCDMRSWAIASLYRHA